MGLKPEANSWTMNFSDSSHPLPQWPVRVTTLSRHRSRDQTEAGSPQQSGHQEEHRRYTSYKARSALISTAVSSHPCLAEDAELVCMMEGKASITSELQEFEGGGRK